MFVGHMEFLYMFLGVSQSLLSDDWPTQALLGRCALRIEPEKSTVCSFWARSLADTIDGQLGGRVTRCMLHILRRGAFGRRNLLGPLLH